jgi:hypothetical protein
MLFYLQLMILENVFLFDVGFYDKVSNLCEVDLTSNSKSILLPYI